MIRYKRTIGTIAYMGGLPATLERFTWAWGQLIAYCYEYLCAPGEIIHLDRATVSFHAFARNSLAERMLGDWLLMLDTDHEPDSDIAVRLVYQMQRVDAAVIVGVYCHRAAPGSPVLYQWNDDASLVLPIADWDEGAELLEVGSAGAGCLLV